MQSDIGLLLLQKEVCKGAMAAFVVYDLSRVTTLSSIADCKKKIHNTVCKKNGNPIPVYLLGNKVGVMQLVIKNLFHILCNYAWFITTLQIVAKHPLL